MPKTVLYTIGYEGRSPSEVVALLASHGVTRLVDVRQTPRSRVKGFSLMSLFERLRKAGITYEHKAELGNPPTIRAFFKNGSVAKGKRLYRNLIENGQSAHVNIIVGLARIEPTALLCVEKDVAQCHRSVLAEVAAERGKFELVHL